MKGMFIPGLCCRSDLWAEAGALRARVAAMLADERPLDRALAAVSAHHEERAVKSRPHRSLRRTSLAAPRTTS